MKYEATLRVPACWKKLIQVEFPEDLVGIKSEKQRTQIDDPEPYYDDDRCVASVFPDGTSFSIAIMSGQGNYYGKYWWEKRMSTFQLQEVDSFCTEYHYFCAGDEYHIKIDWIERRKDAGKDPSEKQQVEV